MDACYKVTYDLSYYTENEKIDCFGRKVVCLLFPWAIRDKANIFYLPPNKSVSMPLSQITKVRISKFD